MINVILFGFLTNSQFLSVIELTESKGIIFRPEFKIKIIRIDHIHARK